MPGGVPGHKMRDHGVPDDEPATSPSAQYSLTLRVEIDHLPGMLGKVASAIGDAGGTIGAVDLVAGRPRPPRTRSATSPSRPATPPTGPG